MRTLTETRTEGPPTLIWKQLVSTFNELGIKPEDVLELDLNSGRYDTKQILLKSEVDSERFVSEFPDTFNGYDMTVTKLTVNKTNLSSNLFPLKSQTMKSSIFVLSMVRWKGE